jgi:hypothetical protein
LTPFLGDALPELSVEEISRLARQYLAGDPTVAEAQRLNSALQEDPQAALELLTRMQEALDQAQPGGMSPAEWQEVDASVEAIIREMASHSTGPLLRLKVWLLKHSRQRAKAASSPSRPLARTLASLAGMALALLLALGLAYAFVAHGGLQRIRSLHLHLSLPHLSSSVAPPAKPAPAPSPAPAVAAPTAALASPAPAAARAQAMPSPAPAAAKLGAAVRAEQPPSSGPLPSELPPVTPMPSGKLNLEQEP